MRYLKTASLLKYHQLKNMVMSTAVNLAMKYSLLSKAVDHSSETKMGNLLMQLYLAFRHNFCIKKLIHLVKYNPSVCLYNVSCDWQ